MGDRMSKGILRRWAVGLGLIAVLLGISGVLWFFVKEYRGYYHFRTVTPGVLYRSGQLTYDAMEEAAEQYKLKTIVNLRENEDPSFCSDGTTEKTWAERHHIQYVSFPTRELVQMNDVLKFLELVDNPRNHPILIHCHQGRKRTGIFVAAYRIAIQGWSLDDAVQDMNSVGAPKEGFGENLAILQTLKGTHWRKLALTQKQPGGGAGPEQKN
jgi:tyrosine-protein phosphatase SIW14